MKSQVFRKKRFIAIRTVIFVLILALVAGITGAVVYWNTAITMYFEGAGSNYTSVEAVDAHDNGVTVCDEIESEGIVLLKNEEAALPLAKNAKVTVFGYDAIDFYYGGAGSGAGGGEKNPTTFQEALEHTGFSVNTEVLDMYRSSGITRGTISMGGSDFSIGEIPQSYYTDALMSSAVSGYGDAAIVVIGRSGAEGGDVATDMSLYESGNTGHYLELNQDEKDMIALACENFSTVIAVINAPSAMELGWITDGTYPNLKAAIWVGQPGPYGMDAIGKVLSGEVNPSGHLVDTYATDLTKNPTYANFGNYEYSDASGYYFVNYNEGIYVGYRYYETRYEDVVLGTANTGDYDYASEVVFPFGYGLSYTDFTWSNFTVSESDSAYEISVDVSNTGTLAGKDVVEIYLQKPYTDYDIATGIEKASVELVGFAKTGLLESGSSETVKVSVSKEQLKAYDEYGYGTYILEAGNYFLTAAAAILRAMA
jgi:beta-glucosidase